MSEVATIKDIDQNIKNLDKDRLLPSKDIKKNKNSKELNNKCLDSEYFKLLRNLHECKHSSFKISLGDLETIQRFNILVKLHLVSAKKNQDYVKYTITKVGEYIISKLLRRTSHKRHKREIIDLIIMIFGFCVAFTLGPIIINPEFCAFAAAPIYGFGEARIIYLALVKSDSYTLHEKDVLPILKRHLDKHDYKISKTVFREHEEDDD